MTYDNAIKSVFAEKCEALQLDPSNTSILQLACAQRGLDPEKTSSFAIACHDRGLDPQETSFAKLASVQLGETERVLSHQDLKAKMGDNWTSEACRYDW